MKYYQEIVFRPMEEISPNFIMAKVMEKLHFLFVSQLHKYGEVRCGVSYPEYKDENKKDLGHIIRIFAPDENTLNEMALASCMKGLSDYIVVSSIKLVPENIASYARYKRYHREGCAGNKVRRYMKRHPECNVKETVKMFAKEKGNRDDHPYVIMKSSSNGHTYFYFVLKEIRTEPSAGAFSTYGTSLGGTVPEF